VKPNTPPAYHVLQPGMSFTDLKNDLFLMAERGNEKYRNNMQDIETYLRTQTFISSKSQKNAI
jgi:hypothetical protein